MIVERSELSRPAHSTPRPMRAIRRSRRRSGSLVETLTYETERPGRSHHPEPARAGQRDHAADAGRDRGLRRAGEPRPRGPRHRPGRQRHRLLRRLRPGRLGRGRHERAGWGRGAARLAARPGDDRRQPHARVELGPGHRLPVHVAQRARLHEPLPLREAGALQGPRLLRRRRHRHGALLGPAGDRRRRQDRLPAGAGLGLADDGAVGGPGRADAGQAAAAHRRLADRRAGGGVGAGDRGGARRPSSTSASSGCSSGSRGCRSTSW